MDEAADYREKADEAERLAAAAPTPSLREAFQYLAEGWRDLARQADERERLRAEFLATVARLLEAPPEPTG